MRSEAPLLAVVAGAVVALALALFVNWELGLIVFGVDLVVAACLRTMLSDVRIGLLSVRGRALDAGMLVIAGGALIVLSTSLAQLH
jgi:hypothetical protein